MRSSQSRSEALQAQRQRSWSRMARSCVIKCAWSSYHWQAWFGHSQEPQTQQPVVIWVRHSVKHQQTLVSDAQVTAPHHGVKVKRHHWRAQFACDEELSVAQLIIKGTCRTMSPLRLCGSSQKSLFAQRILRITTRPHQSSLCDFASCRNAEAVQIIETAFRLRLGSVSFSGHCKSLKPRSDYGSGQFHFMVIVISHFDKNGSWWQKQKGRLHTKFLGPYAIFSVEILWFCGIFMPYGPPLYGIYWPCPSFPCPGKEEKNAQTTRKSSQGKQARSSKKRGKEGHGGHIFCKSGGWVWSEFFHISSRLVSWNSALYLQLSCRSSLLCFARALSLAANSR